MAYSFRPAKRSEAKPLIGLYSESGAGKTWSSLLLARGFVGPTGKVGMIETEAGRGEAYADVLPGGYTVCPIRETFSPVAYGEAITAAEQAGLDALIIDSASHEWEGAGGVLSMAAQNQAGGKHGPLIWQMPKLDHQRHFMLRLLSTPIPLVVVCMRAKYPMKEIMKDGKREWARSEFLEPKQSEDILFEMFIHGWIDREHRFHGTKYTRDDLRTIFLEGQPITLTTGELLAGWAKGGAAPVKAEPAKPEPAPSTAGPRASRLAELQAAITTAIPGAGDRERKARSQVLERLFQVKRWQEVVENVTLERLEAALSKPDLTTPSPLESACLDFAAQMSTA